MSSININIFNNLKIAIILILLPLKTVYSAERLTIESKSKAQKYCLDQWEKACGEVKSDREKFLKCTSEKTEAGCRGILTKMIKRQMKDQKAREDKLNKSTASDKEKFLDCNTKLHRLCPASKFNKDVDQAKCFQANFKSLDKECQTRILKYFSKKKTSNKKLGQ